MEYLDILSATEHETVYTQYEVSTVFAPIN